GAVGLEPVRRHQPHQLSGGQKQRVAIAGVLAMRPRCLVLDEATSMLDPEGQREVLGTALRLSRQEGLALVLITHWMEEAAQADRVLVLAQGRIVLQGSPAEIFSRGSALARLHLEPPEAATLAGELAAAGLPVPPGVITIDQSVESLAPPACPPGGRPAVPVSRAAALRRDGLGGRGVRPAKPGAGRRRSPDAGAPRPDAGGPGPGSVRSPLAVRAQRGRDAAGGAGRRPVDGTPHAHPRRADGGPRSHGPPRDPWTRRPAPPRTGAGPRADHPQQ